VVLASTRFAYSAFLAHYWVLGTSLCQRTPARLLVSLAPSLHLNIAALLTLLLGIAHNLKRLEIDKKKNTTEES